MAYAYQNTIVATFPNHASAERAVVELRAAGFKDNEIGLAGPDNEDGEYTSTGTRIDHTGDSTIIESPNPVVAAETGAIAGASLGAMVGMGILVGAIPVIGPVIAAGTLAVILVNAAEVTAIAGLAGALVGMGVSEVDAKHYEGALKSGKVIVTVRAEGHADEAAEILFRNGGRDRQNDVPELHDKINEVTEPNGHIN